MLTVHWDGMITHKREHVIRWSVKSNSVISGAMLWWGIECYGIVENGLKEMALLSLWTIALWGMVLMASRNNAHGMGRHTKHWEQREYWIHLPEGLYLIRKDRKYVRWQLGNKENCEVIKGWLTRTGWWLEWLVSELIFEVTVINRTAGTCLVLDPVL